MKKIKINFADFWKGFEKTDNIFYQILSEHFEVEISDNPDYLFFSTMGKEYLKYNCIRIFFTGENIRPDFNLCDYAIGFDRLSFQDRYMRYPLFLMYEKDWERAQKKHLLSEAEIQKRERFCNFIYSNKNTRTKRDQFFKLLSEYKQVDSGGKYLNNIGTQVEDKIEWQSHYKFTIAFENSVTPGYVTEKLIHAFAAGTIPIYMGDPQILEDFNEEAMLLCKGEKDFLHVIEQIREIDQDPKLYEKKIKTPVLKNPVAFEQKYGRLALENFLVSICNQETEEAMRRSDYKWTQDLENELRVIRSIEKIPGMRNLIQHSHWFRK